MTLPITTYSINRKAVHVFESHHVALFPWAQISKALDEPPVLITLDHHTDTLDAFLSHRSKVAGGDKDKYRAELDRLISTTDWRNDNQLCNAIFKLKHDEHIHAAIVFDIISAAYAINLSAQTRSIEEKNYISPRAEALRALAEKRETDFSSLLPPPEPPFSYELPSKKIFEICSPMNTEGHTGAEVNWWAQRSDNVIETSYLNQELGIAEQMAATSGLAPPRAPYILDIDLDYFHSEKSIAPDDATRFHELIRNALAITVATEPQCVISERLPDSNVTASYLLAHMLKHIEEATAP